METLDQNSEWAGYMTHENAEFITEQMRLVLTKNVEHSVTCLRDGSPAEVHKTQQLKGPNPVAFTHTTTNISTTNIVISNTYGGWYMWVYDADKDESRKRLGSVHITITSFRILVRHFAHSGADLLWIFSVNE